MTDMQKYLNHAFLMISSISVRGDDVEKMAEAKETLRRAYKLAEEAEKNGKHEQKDGKNKEAENG